MKNIAPWVFSLVPIIITAAVLLNACAPGIQTAGTGVQQVTDFTQIPLNSQGHTTEQQNIIDRLVVTNDPTKVMWIHLISLDGKIINRMPVAHKVTSSGKRLEPLQAAPTGGGYPIFHKSGTDYATTEFLQDDGTLGSSDAYIYWFDTLHRYHQWGTAGGLGYLLTDYPIDLTNPQDLVSSLYNADAAAVKWQALQEAQMCTASGGRYTKPDAQGVGGKCVLPSSMPTPIPTQRAGGSS